MAISTRWFFVLGLFVLPAQARSQALWHGTSYGMSVQQVRQAVSGATNVTDIAEKSSAGPAALLQLDRTRIEGAVYTAKFYFARRRLVQVTLSLVSDRDPAAVQRDFDAVSNRLRGQYGDETRHETQTCKDAMERIEWRADGSRIEVHEAAAADQPREILDIRYQAEAGSPLT
jgi:hypothetical protein